MAQPHDRDLDLAVLRNAWRLDALDKWRAEMDEKLAACRKDIDGMMSAEAVADAVSARVAADRRKLLTFPQKVAASLLTLLLLAQAILSIVWTVRHGG